MDYQSTSAYILYKLCVVHFHVINVLQVYKQIKSSNFILFIRIVSCVSSYHA